jgi:hypothetical protein
VKFSHPSRAAAVLAELELLATRRHEAARRAASEGRAACAWCGVDRQLDELEVDEDDGGVICVDVDRCIDGRG